MPAEALKCKECSTTYPLEARYVCERCFGPLEVAYRAPASDPEELKRRIQAGPHSLWRYADFLPLDRTPRSSLPTGWTPLVRADRLAERLGLGEVWIKNETANPTHSFKDRVVSVALARAIELGFDTVACASTGNLAGAVAAHAAYAGLPAYVFIPADLEPEKILSAGAYGAQIIGVRGNYDAVNRLCTEVSGERENWAFVNVNVRPYYAEGSKTLAFETAEQLGWELPDRVVAPVASGSLFTKVARGFQEFIDAGLLSGDVPAMHGAQAEGCSPVAQAYAAGTERLPPGQARHDRQVARDRQPGRRPVRGRSRPPHGRLGRRGLRRRDPRGHPAARRDDGHLHRDGRRRDHRDAGQARRARRHRRATSASSSTSPATASRRSTRCGAASRSPRSSRASRTSRPRWECTPDGGHDQAPHAAARRRGRRRRGAAPTAPRSARCSRGSTPSTASCATGSPARTASCAASSTSTSRARTSASWTASPRRSPTATRSRSSRPGSGGAGRSRRRREVELERHAEAARAPPCSRYRLS